MSTPNELLVRDVLRSREPDILTAVLRGWDDAKQVPGFGAFRRKSTRAGIVWEKVVDRAIDQLIDDSGVKIVEHFDTRSFIVDDKVLFRFKKGDANRMTRNYPTPLALRFHEHDCDLFGFSGLHRVEVAHVLNAMETKIESVCVVARYRKQVQWFYEIGVEDMTLPLPLPTPVRGPASDLVRVRRATQERKSEGE